jgi:hypothetical protein
MTKQETNALIMRMFWSLSTSTPASEDGTIPAKEMYICTGGNPESDREAWCKTTRSIEPGKFSNLYTHVKTDHKNWETLIESARLKIQPQLQFAYNSHVRAVYGWLDLVVTTGIPFTAVEDETFRKYMKLENISYKTLVKYLDAVAETVARTLANLLPSKFGVVFDGWGGPMNRHYVALTVFADKDGKTAARLLAMQPLLNPTDQGAMEHIALIDSTLKWNGFDRTAVLFFRGRQPQNQPSHCQKFWILGCCREQNTHRWFHWLCLPQIEFGC